MNAQELLLHIKELGRVTMATESGREMILAAIDEVLGASSLPQATPQDTTIEENLADYARRGFEAFQMYRTAWLREMGGVIVPKHWEIDGFVLRARDIYEKAQLVDRIKKILVDESKKKSDGLHMFDAVFKFLAQDGKDKVPTN